MSETKEDTPDVDMADAVPSSDVVLTTDAAATVSYSFSYTLRTWWGEFVFFQISLLMFLFFFFSISFSWIVVIRV
jgi:hypothetical protein